MSGARNAEGPGVKDWSARMQTPEGQTVYAKRFACERPHAGMRNRGLRQFAVRSLEKTKASALWFVHALNYLTIRRLAARQAA